jgi:nickel superoxide dismutase
MKKVLSLLLLTAPLYLIPTLLSAHCQVPCGIYDDEKEFTIMMEHTETIRKAMLEMAKEEDGDMAQSMQQFVRWVNNKESHAQKIQDICAEYFLAQRVKASMDDYEEQLVAVHTIIVAAMKAKQNSDTAYADALEKAIHDYAHIYLDQ